MRWGKDQRQHGHCPLPLWGGKKRVLVPSYNCLPGHSPLLCVLLTPAVPRLREGGLHLSQLPCLLCRICGSWLP